MAEQAVAEKQQTTVGPLMIQLMSGIGPDTPNDQIDAWVALVVQGVLGMGITTTKWVSEMAYQFRGIQCGVDSDYRLYQTRAWSAWKLTGAIDARSYTKLMDMADSKRVAKGPVRSWRDKPAKPKAEAKKDVPTPGLDAAIDIIDAMSKAPLPGGLKGAINGLKASLELKRATLKGEPAPKQALELAEAMFEVMKALIEVAAQDAQLAADAAKQLGTIAKFIGYAGKAIAVIEGVYKIVTGKTFGGKALTKGEKIDAAIDVICAVTGPIGLAAGISLGAFKWIWVNIGVPVKEATETTQLKAFFGNSVEDFISEIDKLPTEPRLALWTINKVRYKTFKPVRDPLGTMILADEWERYCAATMQGDNAMMEKINASAKHHKNPGDDETVAGDLTRVAEDYKSAAKLFVYDLLAKIRGRWARQ